MLDSPQLSALALLDAIYNNFDVLVNCHFSLCISCTDIGKGILFSYSVLLSSLISAKVNSEMQHQKAIQLTLFHRLTHVDTIDTPVSLYG